MGPESILRVIFSGKRRVRADAKVEESHFKTISVAGIPFAVTSTVEAVSWLINAAMEPRAVAVRLSNAYCVALASKTPEYREILTGPGINFPDGAPVAAMMKLKCARNKRRPRRVRGPSLFEETLSAAEQTPLRHYFLGGSTHTAQQLGLRLEQEVPKLKIAGIYSPPYSEVDSAFYELVLPRILEARPDIVWVGLGTPKQDFATLRLATSLGVPCVGVGAAFDFFAGTVRQAPRSIQDSGFEWLYRLSQDPKRLWRRYLFGNVRFLIEALRK